MSALQIKESKQINGKEIKVIEGGFGEEKRCLFAKQIAEIHSMELKHVNELINRNRKRFKDNIDIVDVINNEDFKVVVNDLGLKSSNRTKNIYALSERGYSKLIKIMDTDLAWEIHDELMDNYFKMREIINSNEQLKANLLLSIYNGGQEGILASKKLTYIEVKEATKPLLDKIEKDKPKVEFTEVVLKSSDNILVRELAKIATDEGIKIGQNNLYKKLREWGYIFKNGTEPYQHVMDKGYFVVKETASKTPYGVKLNKTTLVTPLGQVKIIEKLRKELADVA